MISSLSTMAPRARLHPHVAPAATTAFPAALLRHRQQTRSFRFGAWSDNESRDQHREMRRRCRAGRRSDADFGRKGMWGRQQDFPESMPHRNWQPKRFFAFAQRWAGPRSGDRRSRDTPFDDLRNYMAQRHKELLKEAGFGTQSSSFATATSGPSARTNPSGAVKETDYVIDPITNRKVPKGPTKSASSSPVLDADLPPTAAELRAYKDGFMDETAGSESAASPDLSSISDSADTCYMSWKYKNVFSGQDGAKYNDLHKYKPVAWNEPDGKPTESRAELGRDGYDPDEVAKYQAVRWNEPTGKPAEMGHEGCDPAEVSKYQPVRWNEPDGKPKDAPVELGHEGYDPEEVAKYKPVRWNEPEGKPNAPVELGHEGYDPEEVAKYKPFYWNEPDGQPTTPPAEIGHHGYDPAEVAQYKPFMYNEPDGKPTTPTVELGHEGYDPAEVAKYKPFKYNEPDGKPTTPQAELGHEGYDPAEVQKYRPVQYNEPDGKPPASAAEAAGNKTSELGSYGAFRYQEPDGQPPEPVDRASESLKEYDLKADASKTETSEEALYAKVLKRARERSMEAKSANEPGAPPSREALESSLDRMNAESDAVDRLAHTSVRASQGRTRRRMSAAERKQAMEDPYSTEPQGLETAFAEECVDTNANVWPAYAKTYTAAAAAAASSTASSTDAFAGPVLYKILAYDAATQSVRAAETTSSVPDAAAPLAPGEVMLRLSHPTKFLPHLKPLAKQGFEMVAGGGDVLVFRQASAAGVVSDAGTESSSSSTSSTSPRVRREEPVFSGSKARAGAAMPEEAAPSEKGASGLGKRVLVGATWAGGIAYALGVVSEYVKAL